MRAKIGSAPDVEVLRVGGTAIVQVGTESESRQAAAAATNAYMESYLEFRRRQANEALTATSRQIQAAVDDLQAQIDDLSARLRSVACPATGDCPEREALEQDRDARLTEQVPFRQRLAELNIDASSVNVGGVVTPASPPTDPVRPTPLRNGVLGVGLGLVLAVALALAFEYLDDSIRDALDVERAVPGLPVVAVIPPARVRRRDRHERRVVALSDPTSAAAEAYRRLRTSIRSMGVDRPMRWIQVTSATASEGKTTTAANLGLVLSRAGERVIVVSWDLRRPRLHEHFRLSNEVGLTSVLLGDVTLADALQQVTDDRRLWLLAAGPIPPNPSDLLSSVRAREVLGALRADGSAVVFDCPPVLPVADAAILAERVDGTLLVTRAGASSRKKIARAVGVVRQAGAPLLGSVLHAASVESAYDYGYPYGDREPVAGRGAGSSLAGGSVPAGLNGGGAHHGTEGVIRQSQNGPVDGSPPPAERADPKASTDRPANRQLPRSTGSRAPQRGRKRKR